MKALSGKIISDKMKDVAVVEVTRFYAHPIYRKRIRRSKRFHARNTIGAKIGDMVELVETRQVAKTVHWRVIKIVKPHVAT